MGTTQPKRNKKTLENFRNYYKKGGKQAKKLCTDCFWTQLGITD